MSSNDSNNNTSQYSRRARSPVREYGGAANSDRISRAREREKGRDRSPKQNDHLARGGSHQRQRPSYGQNYQLNYGSSYGSNYSQNQPQNYGQNNYGQNYGQNYSQNYGQNYNNQSHQHNPRHSKHDNDSSYRPSGPRDRGRERYLKQPPRRRHGNTPDEPVEISSTSSVATQPKEEEVVVEDPVKEIAKIESRLKDMTNVKTMKELKVLDSRWDVKPQGFENVSAQRAKLSGLFPLPGYPRPVDFTKLEGLVKTRLMDSNDILNENSSISPIDSRNSKVIIVDGLDFDKISYMKIVEYFNDTLKKIDIEETTVQNIEKKWLAQDKKKLIVTFNNNTCATIILALNECQLPVSEFTKDNDEVETNPESNTDETFKLKLDRPGEYVIQLLPKYTSTSTDDIFTNVVDSPRKLTLIVPLESTETEIVDELRKIGQIKCFQLLREIGTKASLGISFVEFFVDPVQSNDKSTGDMIHLVQEILEKVKQLPIIKKAYFSCITLDKTAIQDCPTTFETIPKLVKNELATPHPKLKVIQLLNIVIARDLVDDADFKFTENDIKRELSKFGRIVTMKIPRPSNDYTPGLIQFSQPGLGKVYVEFEDEAAAMNAIMGTAGRQYNDRTVLCTYFDYADYKNSLL